MSLLAANRSYRLLFSATAISNLGDGVSALAFPWLATLITRDPMLIAAIAFATRLPWLLFAIPAGVIVDRADRRVLMVRADLVRLGLTALVIALVISAPSFPLPGSELPYVAALGALAFLLGTAEVIRDNAAQTVLPSIIPKPDLERANGQLWSVEQIMGSFVGPPLAGVLIALAVPAPFVLDAISFGLAALLVWAIALPRRKAPPPRRMRVEMAEGWRWMRAHPMVLRLAIMLGIINALSTMGLTILILVSQEVFRLDAVGHGILLTAGAAGGVVGGLAGPWVIARIGGQRAVMLALALFPLPMLVIGLTHSPWIAGAALFLEMIAALLWNIVTVSWRQRLIPDELLGRVNSLYRFFGWGMMPVGALAAGWVVGLAEPGLGRETALRLPYLLGAGGAGLLAFYGWAQLRLTQPT
ncbi:MFS transporter [Rhodophyticola sp. CCM32]|uniref:MFS transporter n=1 Tax=Rhodophyticola sp. CCM32 TaxID=2916397 RepID=UPI00107F75B5|nr:MFS transporter [Rhodophyticola sp. CCM32]QBX99496.1 MFS transporter [Rhodophyticola sp. CCM32]